MSTVAEDPRTYASGRIERVQVEFRVQYEVLGEVKGVPNRKIQSDGHADPSTRAVRLAECVHLVACTGEVYRRIVNGRTGIR